ncbi:Gp15 family bacteriophage protein [Salipaludibacillus aurantiacus]|uniref:Bacteriophage Gp15 protein n=1 Tax=Salipaludibacillus aurantiacus TaxID=1601833 RepID=A0A1H9TZZ4_9BACI|nr:Gp15 family bacteriophage protein [Salipaludibacillus aurantiacus]SES02612.1 Bacteriophage Gp15 protein [Salipaludibacillus aurantiacus]
MSFSLTTDYTDEIEFDGRTYTVDTAFDTVLMVFELLEDDTFLDFEKITIALELFLDEEFKDEDWKGNFELFKRIFNEHLDIDLDEKSEDGSEKKIYDFEKDAELIYASFFSAYNIDLIEAKGDLPWHKFIKLLCQLDEKSPFKKAIGYRTMKIPKETKHNKDHVKELKRLKQAYALDQEPESQESLDSKLDSAFSAFKGGGKT